MSDITYLYHHRYSRDYGRLWHKVEGQEFYEFGNIECFPTKTIIPVSEFIEIMKEDLEEYKDKVWKSSFMRMKVNHYINKSDYIIDKALSDCILDFDKIKLNEKMQSLIDSRIYNLERKTKRKVIRN